ncbi:PhzF family phenazine biosynthesis protein [Dactylosporangium sp. CS-047395]|uniref:PhzF family phenazine biosynthesis protein n=1 Tax=Dactylosporangium sp. CS-047395 TaxID=3239936 RepID=UPI003D8DD50B
MTAFAYVDVFASAPLTGAPLTLVPDADGLSDAQLRAIAREFNQSETTFVVTPTRPGATRRLRSFTPTGEEVFGAGHNALGAWLWLADTLLSGDSDTFHQEIGADVLPVYATRAADGRISIAMEQSPPFFGAAAEDRAELAAALGLDESSLVAGRDARVVSTGAGHLLVPVGSRADVDRVAVHADRLVAVLRGCGGEGCYVYTLEGGAYARFFNPAMGIPEDPATGTAAGPLAALLVSDGLAESPVVIEQGHAMGRPSRITVTVTGSRVVVEGSGVVSATGTLHLS